jgi:hypothetical protein
VSSTGEICPPGFLPLGACDYRSLCGGSRQVRQSGGHDWVKLKRRDSREHQLKSDPLEGRGGEANKPHEIHSGEVDQFSDGGLTESMIRNSTGAFCGSNLRPRSRMATKMEAPSVGVFGLPVRMPTTEL